MLTRSHGYLKLRSGPLPKAVKCLQTDGYVVLNAVFDAKKVDALRADVERVFAEYPPDERGDTPEEAAPFRYEMLNRSAPSSNGPSATPGSSRWSSPCWVRTAM